MWCVQQSALCENNNYVYSTGGGNLQGGNLSILQSGGANPREVCGVEGKHNPRVGARIAGYGRYPMENHVGAQRPVQRCRPGCSTLRPPIKPIAITDCADPIPPPLACTRGRGWPGPIGARIAGKGALSKMGFGFMGRAQHCSSRETGLIGPLRPYMIFCRGGSGWGMIPNPTASAIIESYPEASHEPIFPT